MYDTISGKVSGREHQTINYRTKMYGQKLINIFITLLISLLNTMA